MTYALATAVSMMLAFYCFAIAVPCVKWALHLMRNATVPATDHKYASIIGMIGISVFVAHVASGYIIASHAWHNHIWQIRDFTPLWLVARVFGVLGAMAMLWWGVRLAYANTADGKRMAQHSWHGYILSGLALGLIGYVSTP